MNDEQNLALINAANTLFQIRLAGMIAENQQCKHEGCNLPFGIEHFNELHNEAAAVLGHNAITSTFITG